MNLSHKIAHNTFIQMGGKIVSTILGLVSLAFITRYLGQAGFGEYTTIITFLTIFAVLADFGLTLVTVQMISGINEKQQENKILNNLLGFRLSSIIFFLLLTPLIVWFFPYSQTIKIGIILTAPYFIFPALNQVIIGLLQKKLSMDRAALAEVISRLILLLGVVLVWHLNLGLRGILLTTIASGTTSFISHFVLARKFSRLKPAWDLTLWREIIRRSWPLAITVILNLIYLRADIIFLSLFKGNNEVGLYGAAYRVVDVLTTLPFMFAGLILPVLTTAWLEKKGEFFHKIMQKSFDAMVIVAIPLVFGALLFAQQIMIVVAGEEFADSGPILKLLIIAVAAIFIGTIFSHAVIALDKQKKLISFYAFTAFSALIAYVLFIPKYSYFGAAGITIYSELLIAIFSAYCVFKYSNFLPKFNIVLKSIGASLLMSGFVLIYPHHWQDGWFGLILVIFFAAIIYFVVLFLIGGIKPAELRVILKKSAVSPPYNSNNI